LVVIGVIVVLVTLLFAVISRVREAGRTTTCLSNLNNIAHAIIAYAIDNNGAFPGGAQGPPQPPPAAISTLAIPSDWIWWQSFRINQIGQGGTGPYLNLSPDPRDLAVLRCPSDNLGRISFSGAGGFYLFSYVLNGFMSSSNGRGSGGTFGVRCLRDVLDAPQKVLVYEEDWRKIKDGSGSLQPSSNPVATELLSIRHGSKGVGNDDPKMAITMPGVPRVVNPGAMGNVAFCDGHAASITRADAHSRLHFAPDSGTPPWPVNNSVP
jgi:prepilin-type processing-associated H-X9-DG protein